MEESEVEEESEVVESEVVESEVEEESEVVEGDEIFKSV